MPNATDGKHPSVTKYYPTIDSNARPPATLDGDAYRLLGNRRRRYLVYCLLDRDGETSLSSAVDVVTAWERDCPVEEVRTTDRRCVYSTLRRTHLPQLEAEGVVAYDADASVVSLGPDAEKVTRFLDGDEPDWSGYYLGAAALAGVLYVPEFAAILPVLLPQGGEHLTAALLFVGLTAAVAYDSYRE